LIWSPLAVDSRRPRAVTANCQLTSGS